MTSSLNKFGAGIATNVILLAVVSFLVDVSSEIIFPLLPFFLVLTLGASYFIVGIMEGSAELIASLVKIFSGYWSDRVGRRKVFVLSGYGASALLKGFFALSTSWVHVFFLRIAERIGKGVREPARDAIVAESSPPEAKGKAFGFQRAMDTGGAILGPIFAIVLLVVFAYSYRPIFLIATIPAVLAFLVGLFLKERGKREERKAPSKLGLRFLPIRLRVFVVVASIFALGSFSFFFAMLRAVDLGQSETMTLAFYLLMNITFALSAMPAGALSDRIGRIPTIALGYSLFAVVCILFSLQIGVVLIGLAFLIFGLSNGFVDGVQRAYVCDLAPNDIRATCLGTYHMSSGIAKLISSAVVGALWSFVGVRFAFAYGALMSLVAATMLFALQRK